MFNVFLTLAEANRYASRFIIRKGGKMPFKDSNCLSLGILKMIQATGRKR
jgi:hypothetical protein